jgi:hypothetical protein
MFGGMRVRSASGRLIWLGMIALVCAGCAQSRTDRGSGSPAGGGAPHISPEVAAAAKICRWSIANSLYRTHTTPGSYVTRPPGSCPHAELAAALALADGLKAGGSRGAGICQLLAPDALSNARRVAMNTHVACGQAALEPAAAGPVPVGRRVSHLAGLLLTSYNPGPPRWFGFLEFAPLGAERHPRDPRYAPLVVAITRLPSGRWAIAQIGYEF